MIAFLALAVISTAGATPKSKPAKKTAPKTTPPKPDPTPAPTTPDPTPAAPATPEPPKPDPMPAAPAPTPGTPGMPAPASTEVKVEGSDVDSLRQEYLTLRDELFKSRARANAVAGQLYSTRVTIKLTYTTARYYNPAKASIRLDGANVYENATGAIAGDDGVRFDGFVAPGKHLITFHVEAIGKDDDSFTSTTESQIVVKAIANKDLVVSAKAKDGGDIAYEWKRKERGSYGLGIDVSVKTEPHLEGAKK